MSTLQQPQVVKIAVIILKFTLLFILATSIMSIVNSEDYRAVSSLNIGNGVYASTMLIMLALLWLLFYLISLGLNFARKIYLFIFLVNLIGWIINIYQNVHVIKEITFIFAMFELGLGLIAIILLFLPVSNYWFIHGVEKTIEKDK